MYIQTLTEGQDTIQHRMQHHAQTDGAVSTPEYMQHHISEVDLELSNYRIVDIELSNYRIVDIELSNDGHAATFLCNCLL